MSYVRMFMEGSASDRALLGGKGANLAEMTRMGLPVPPGFIVTTDACRHYLHHGEAPDGLRDQVRVAVQVIEAETGRRFGDPVNPLLLSVRSGAPFSMPGMMETVLNLGLNRENVKALAATDEHFAHDAFRRLVQMFGEVVQDIPGRAFAAARAPFLRDAGVDDVAELSAADLEAVGHAYLQVVEQETGEPFPMDPDTQLQAAIEAVFRSWNGHKARTYRALENISDELGTAVNVQTMVFGNLGDRSATGVVFTRDPATGENVPYGDALKGAQGEDVVAGTRNTMHLAELRHEFPEQYDDLLSVLSRLEQRYRDMCDIEFTIEDDRLWILQTRVGKRSARAALRMAVEMVDEGLIDEPTAIRRFTPTQLERLLHPQFDPDATYDVVAKGLGASPGAASGRAVFDADEAERVAADGTPVILVRVETAADDVHGMVAAQGIVTAKGGLVSHAAVVARGIGRPAVCGVAELTIDEEAGTATANGLTIEAGDVISIDGSTGEVALGKVRVVRPEPGAELDRLLQWADQLRSLGVRANADTAEDARRAVAFGAEGIGLCRTEHLFVGARAPMIERFILSQDQAEVDAALQELHDVHVEELTGVLEAMDGKPVTVRLLDPPLHEFLPSVTELRVAEAKGELDDAGLAKLAMAERWHEHNPMLGIRGVRLAALAPDLYRMQAHALAEAVVARIRAGGNPRLQVMIPLVVSTAELAHARDDVAAELRRSFDAAAIEVDVPIGTMLETPRAAVIAGELAAGPADFLSFGTNDLTQMTFGFSRDDVEGPMMEQYVEMGLLEADPFATLDRVGVGALMRMAVDAIRAADALDDIGICGEHGGEPASIAFCHELGLDYVSCSPFRVRTARLAAAHAALAD